MKTKTFSEIKSEACDLFSYDSERLSKFSFRHRINYNKGI